MELDEVLPDGNLADVFILKQQIKTGKYRHITSAQPKSKAVASALGLSGGVMHDVAIRVENKRPSDDPGSSEFCPDGWIGAAEKEADVLNALNGQGVPKLYFHRASQSRSVAVMELLHGESLATLLSREVLREKDARVLAKGLLECVQFLHSSGIVHCSISLNHTVLQAPGDVSRPKLVDLRFVTSVGPSSTNEIYVPQNIEVTSILRNPTSLVFGNRHYSPPEQIRGFVSFKTDLFEAGSCLYTILTQKQPFKSFLEPMRVERTYDELDGDQRSLWKTRGRRITPSFQPSPPSESLTLSSDVHSKEQLAEQAANQRFDECPPTFANAGVSRTATDLISALLSPELDKRPSVQTALRHPWVLALSSAVEDTQRRDNQCMCSRLFSCM